VSRRATTPGLLLVLFAMAAAGCPDKKSAPPPPDAAPQTIPAPTGSVASEIEAHERQMKVSPELCENISKRYNALRGMSKGDMDSKVMELMAACQGGANLAWYKCCVRATTAVGIEECTARLLP
jgi:hypothetical protein